MAELAKKPETILFIDFGSVNTRACLFDLKNGQYIFSGAASAKTTHNGLTHTEYLGASNAIAKLEAGANRKFMDRNRNIIQPQRPDLSGVGQVLAVSTCTEKPRIVLVGLTWDGSIRNMRTMLAKTGIVPVAEICAADGDAMPVNIDKILQADPQLILVSGGTNGGAEKALYRLGELLMLVCKSLPQEQRPEILFLGNAAARRQFENVFKRLTDFRIGPNVLAQRSKVSDTSMSELIKTIQAEAAVSAPGLKLLKEQTGCTAMPGELAFGRFLRLLSRLTKQNRYVVGVDVGSRQTIMGYASNLELQMAVKDTGLGKGILNLLDQQDPQVIKRWLNFQIKDCEINDYIQNKNIYADLVPANQYAAGIEQALTRQILRSYAEKAEYSRLLESGLVGAVLLSGAVMRNVQDPAESLMMAMDGLHAKGIVDCYLDMNGLAFAIGAAISANQELAVHLTNPTSFLNLGKVITPLSNAKDGRRILSVSIRDEAGNVKKFDIIQGRILRIPLDYGKYFELDWTDIQAGTDVPGVRVWKPVSFKSGCFGVVFDTRGNQINFPAERSEQIAKVKQWRKDLGPWVYDD